MERRAFFKKSAKVALGISGSLICGNAYAQFSNITGDKINPDSLQLANPNTNLNDLIFTKDWTRNLLEKMDTARASGEAVDIQEYNAAMFLHVLSKKTNRLIDKRH